MSNAARRDAPPGSYVANHAVGTLTEGEAPLVSVVIAATTGGAALSACAGSFRSQDSNRQLELIVVARGGVPPADPPMPDVRIVHLASSATIPQLRAAGLRAARGRILAITQDHCTAEEGWLMAVVDAHRAPDIAVGGAVEIEDGGRTVDWAVDFCEYGRYMLPLATGPSADLPGSNVTYK